MRCGLPNEHPEREIVFFAVGFETTAPATALAVHQAAQLGLKNFSLVVSHVRVQPAMEMLASSEDSSVEGFLAAGHVCTVAGFESYREFVETYRMPVVVTGFEPVDLLSGILECVRQLERGEAQVANCYGRSVAAAGNSAALAIVDDVYEICDRPWRGLGVVPSGGFRLREKWAQFDAEKRFGAASWRSSQECVRVPQRRRADGADPADGVRTFRQSLHAGNRRSGRRWSRRKGRVRRIFGMRRGVGRSCKPRCGGMAEAMSELVCAVAVGVRAIACCLHTAKGGG